MTDIRLSNSRRFKSGCWRHHQSLLNLLLLDKFTSDYLTRLEFVEIEEEPDALADNLQHVVVVGVTDEQGNPWDGKYPWEDIVKDESGYYDPDRVSGGTQTPAEGWREGNNVEYYPFTYAGGTAIYEKIEYRSRWQIYDTSRDKYVSYPGRSWKIHGNNQDNGLWLTGTTQ